MERLRPIFLVVSLAAAAGAACYTGPNVEPTTSGPSATEPTVTTGTKTSDLPCEVATFIDKHCAECHSSNPRGGAKTTLTTRAGMAEDVDGRSAAVVSLERMRGDGDPMPPDGLLAESDFAAFAKWVDDGMPQGTCEGLEGPAAIKLSCTSGKFWTEGDDEGDEEMTPGQACISCHTKENGGRPLDDDGEEEEEEGEDEAPVFTAAGTVYPSLHEPDDCYGLGGSAIKVILTGADGKKQTLSVNRAGNFMTEAPLKLPYKASVVRNGKTRTMKEPQRDGDCNGCHTAEGGDAPGRIIAP